MKFLKWMIPAVALPVLLAGCGGGESAGAAGRGVGKDGKGKDGAPAGPAREVRLATAEEGRLARTIDVSGTLAADEQAELSFKVTGRLQQMSVDIGSPVRRGQVIARLVPTDSELRVRQAETALQQARTQLGLPPNGSDERVVPEETALVKGAAATLRQAQLTRDRMVRLFDEKLIPQSDLDAAEAALGVAEGRYQEAIETARTRQGLLAQRKSELAIAQQQLADTVLKAPFDGVIRERVSSVGDYVAAGTPVVRHRARPSAAAAPVGARARGARASASASRCS